MADGDIVMIGLPSEGLLRLADHFDIRHLQDAEIRRACDSPDEPRAFTLASMAGRLGECFQGGGSRKTLVIYQTPWGFLERQTGKAVSLSGRQAQLESFAGNTLGLWYAFHATLLGLHREHEGHCLLINGDRRAETGAVAALVEERFGFRPRPQPNPPAREGLAASGAHENSWRQIVDTLAPQCMDLYAELESCAELMGRQPELDWSGFAGRQAHMVELQQLLPGQRALEGVLDRYGIARGDVEPRLEAILLAHESAKKENELYLLQLHKMQEELDRNLELKQQKDQRLAELRQRLERQKEQQLAELRQRLERQKEQQLAELQKQQERAAAGERQVESVKKENELYRLQIHQIEEELKRYFELNRQKDQKLAELQQRLDLESAPVLRKIARKILGPRKPAPRLDTSAAGPTAGSSKRNRRQKRVLRKQVEKIRASGLFDENWYLQTYPDVARDGQDPIGHYLRFGVAEGRNPSAHFDTQWYLEAYADVAAAGLNPLLHYLQFGRDEGRQPMRLVA